MKQHNVNPGMINSIAFVEFVAQDPVAYGRYLNAMGFRRTAVSEDGLKTLYRQASIDFIVNCDNRANAGTYRAVHGNGVSAIAFLVDDAAATLQHCLNQNCTVAKEPDFDCPALQGIGGSIIYLVDEAMMTSTVLSQFTEVTDTTPVPDIGLLDIDHLTHNVTQGRMSAWERFYSRVFHFHRIKTFDIKGSKTGLRSVAMSSPEGNVKIPINESSDDHSQIAEFIRLNAGEGVQHIALTTRNIYQTTERMMRAGVAFQETPATYYELLDNRLPNHGEDTEALRKMGILLDGDKYESGRKLLQIFTRESLGPMFFEVIQRKGNAGFGEGNFQALFESIELDQMRRGVV